MPSFQERLSGDSAMREMERENWVVDQCQDQQPWADTLSLAADQLQCATFSNCGEEIVRFDPMGGVHVNPKYETREAAQRFIATVREIWGQQQKCLSGEHEALLRFPLANVKGDGVSLPFCRHCRALYVEKA